MSICSTEGMGLCRVLVLYGRKPCPPCQSTCGSLSSCRQSDVFEICPWLLPLSRYDPCRQLGMPSPTSPSDQFRWRSFVLATLAETLRLLASRSQAIFPRSPEPC